MKIAIDFGISNTDVIIDHEYTEFHSLPSNPELSGNEETIISVFEKLNISDLPDCIRVTGGKSANLPNRVRDAEILKIKEIDAIACGARKLFEFSGDALIVSAGTGTACVWAHGLENTHLGGIAVGGGTFEGLGKLLTGNPNGLELNEFGEKGDRKKIDLLLNDVVTELGKLPGNITAVNFGQVKKNGLDTIENVSASLGNMMGEVIGTLAALYAHILEVKDVYFVGRTVNLSLIRNGIDSRLSLSNLNGHFSENGGFANALGALHHNLTL
ncbi:MAG: pantothenate kinase [Gammaproteobacteria bacterium]